MRQVLHGDVTSAARVLLRLPPDQRAPVCARLIEEADAAHRYAKRLGRVHPLWGNGTLMAAARRRVLADEPRHFSPDYCTCLEMVLQALGNWRAGRISLRRSRCSAALPDRASGG